MFKHEINIQVFSIFRAPDTPKRPNSCLIPAYCAPNVDLDGFLFMTVFPSGFSSSTANARPLHLIERAHYRQWHGGQPKPQQDWLDAIGFEAAPGSLALLPDAQGLAGAVLGIGDIHDPFSYAHAPLALPEGDWTALAAPDPAALQLGWGLGAYRFGRYRGLPARAAARLALDSADDEALQILAAVKRVRDLVNTPSEDMGPEELETIVNEIANIHHAQSGSIVGKALLEQDFPAIYAVGRASHRAPRLIHLHWHPDGKDSQDLPHVVLVGKGVCFDTGGLDIKAAEGMRLMKKDMGGAAHAIALAELIMARRLPLRLTLLIPAVENVIGPDAYRPGDIIKTRKGIQVEVDNTDAEGRIVLCDALTYAGELGADLIVDFATLTSAARIALGPDLPALFCNDDALAAAFMEAGQRSYDPVWRMPLWRPYLRYLGSQVADIANSGSRMAGSVTAALYLERFIPENIRWAHLDTYAWNDHPRPGRPQGGEALGLRAAYLVLKKAITDAALNTAPAAP